MNFEVKEAMRKWQQEVDAEVVRLIESGTPPYDAIDEARRIVKESEMQQNMLGEQREPESYFEDGSYTCPFCCAAVLAEWPTAANGMRCQNPQCTASVWATREIAQQIQDKADALKREREERERNHRSAMARIEREHRERMAADDAAMDKARTEGFCTKCVFQSYGRYKFIRHRSGHEHLAN